jgi:hypothetical protein
MRQLVLNEEQIKQLEAIIMQAPTQWGMPIIQILQQGLKDVSDAVVDGEAK